MDRINSLFTGALRLLGINSNDNTSSDRETRPPPPPQPGARPTPTSTSTAPRLSLNFVPTPPSRGSNTPFLHNDHQRQQQGQAVEAEAEQRHIKSARPDPSTVVRIALILSRKLPRDLVPLVLDHAQLWPLTAHIHESYTPDLRISQAQAGRVVGALQIPHSVAPGSIRRVRLTTDSKDQGWSSFNEDRGSYRNSWTWFEAGIRDRSPVRQGRDMGLSDLRENGLVSESELEVGAEADNASESEREGYLLGPRKIVTNVHAGWNFATHEVIWDVEHEDEALREAVRALRPGQTIQVSAWARFPGWTNQVRRVSIELECQSVRKM